MTTTGTRQGNSGTLPPRTVEEREKKFPALSIAYRAFAQMEIWCMEGGGSQVDDYCGLFAQPGPFEGDLNNVRLLLRTGTTGSTATKDTCARLVGYIFNECKTGGTNPIDPPDPHRRFPSLTWLYRYYVVHGNNQAEAESVMALKAGVLDDLVNCHLIW